MNPNSVRPRRLHVSALAAVANPSYTRLDTWNLLDDACRHLAEVDLAGLDTTHDVARAKRLMDRIGAYERYWLHAHPVQLSGGCQTPTALGSECMRRIRLTSRCPRYGRHR